MTHALRFIAFGWWIQLRVLTASRVFVFSFAIQPIVYATIAFYMFRTGDQSISLSYAALGAGLLGAWSATLFGAGGSLVWQRWQGTLEALVVAPLPFAVTAAPMCLAAATTGLCSIVATMLWARLFFGLPLEVEHPALLAVSLTLTILALAVLGLVLAAIFILYRHASALQNVLDYPIWMTSGLLIPLSLLPYWVRPLSWLLAPAWGVRAVQQSVLGGSPAAEIGICAGATAISAVVAVLALNVVVRQAQVRATLSLS